jgi:hypothetical protein
MERIQSDHPFGGGIGLFLPKSNFGRMGRFGYMIGSVGPAKHLKNRGKFSVLTHN